MIKKSIFLSFAVLLFSFSAKAQFSLDRFSIVEARAGLNISSIGDDILASSKVGIHLGGMISYELMENVSIRGGLMFSQKGARISGDYRSYKLGGSDTLMGGYTEGIFLNAYYLEIPITASLNIPMDFLIKDASIQLNIGPTFSIGMYGSTVYDSVDYNYPGVQPITSFPSKFNTFGGTMGIRRFDIGALMELGFTWRNYSLQMSYNHGFIILGDETSFIGRKGSYMGTNNVFMLTLAYRFKLNDE